MTTIKRRRCRAIDMEFIVLFGMLLIMVKPSMQIKSNHPLHGIVDAINEDGGPYIGLVMTFPTEEIALQASGFFLPSHDFPPLQLAGRTFNIGSIMGVNVIYVMSGEQTTDSSRSPNTEHVLPRKTPLCPLVRRTSSLTCKGNLTNPSENSEVNGEYSIVSFVALSPQYSKFKHTNTTGITVQILLDAFDIKGVVHYGIAGSSNDSLVIGDVSVPEYVAFTSSWKWTEYKATEKGDLPELAFGNYNVPNEGDNLLAKIEFQLEQLYSVGKPVEEVFWLPLEPKWLSIATQLKDLKLQQCVNETYCLPNTPKLVYGLKGSSADVYLDNAAYRSFLFKKFNISTVDEESAAVTMTCLSNRVPCIVFRGVSDMAGGGGTSVSLTSLAAINAVNAAAHFIGLLDKESSSRDQ